MPHTFQLRSPPFAPSPPQELNDPLVSGEGGGGPDDPSAQLRALLPVSFPRKGDVRNTITAMRNMWCFVSSPLACGLGDQSSGGEIRSGPLARLKATADATDALKSSFVAPVQLFIQNKVKVYVRGTAGSLDRLLTGWHRARLSEHLVYHPLTHAHAHARAYTHTLTLLLSLSLLLAILPPFSLFPRSRARAAQVLPWLPLSLSRQTCYDIFTRHTCVFTNVPGPGKAILFAKQEVTGIQMVFPNLISQVRRMRLACMQWLRCCVVALL